MKQLTLSECSKRKLDETYLVVYAIKNEINIKKGDYIEKSDIYTLIGIDIKGYRQFLNIYQDRVNNNRFWLDCFETLKSRGLKNILFLSVDNNKNMKRTAKIAFPDIVFVDSLTHIVPKYYKYTSERTAKNLASKLHSLYTQKTLNDFKEAFKQFSDIYNNSIHQKLSQKYLSNIENQYKYSENVRNLLFKHSANLEFYDRIRLSFNSNNNYVLDIEEIYDKLYQPIMQRLLDTELDLHLQYSKYEHSKDKNNLSDNARNGHCKAKKVKTEYGNIEVQTPRDRNATFEPMIIEKGQTRLTGFEDKCIALYAKGMSLRDIERTLKEMYGVKINKDQITTLISAVSEETEKWKIENLNLCMFLLMLIVSMFLSKMI